MLHIQVRVLTVLNERSNRFVGKISNPSAFLADYLHPVGATGNEFVLGCILPHLSFKSHQNICVHEGL